MNEGAHAGQQGPSDKDLRQQPLAAPEQGSLPGLVDYPGSPPSPDPTFSLKPPSDAVGLKPLQGQAARPPVAESPSEIFPAEPIGSMDSRNALGHVAQGMVTSAAVVAAQEGSMKDPTRQQDSALTDSADAIAPSRLPPPPLGGAPAASKPAQPTHALPDERSANAAEPLGDRARDKRHRQSRSRLSSSERTPLDRSKQPMDVQPADTQKAPAQRATVEGPNAPANGAGNAQGRAGTDLHSTAPLPHAQEHAGGSNRPKMASEGESSGADLPTAVRIQPLTAKQLLAKIPADELQRLGSTPRAGPAGQPFDTPGPQTLQSRSRSRSHSIEHDSSGLDLARGMVRPPDSAPIPGAAPGHRRTSRDGAHHDRFNSASSDMRRAAVSPSGHVAWDEPPGGLPVQRSRLGTSGTHNSDAAFLPVHDRDRLPMPHGHHLHPESSGPGHGLAPGLLEPSRAGPVLHGGSHSAEFHKSDSGRRPVEDGGQRGGRQRSSRWHPAPERPGLPPHDRPTQPEVAAGASVQDAGNLRVRQGHPKGGWSMQLGPERGMPTRDARLDLAAGMDQSEKRPPLPVRAAPRHAQVFEGEELSPEDEQARRRHRVRENLRKKQVPSPWPFRQDPASDR